MCFTYRGRFVCFCIFSLHYCIISTSVVEDTFCIMCQVGCSNLLAHSLIHSNSMLHSCSRSEVLLVMILLVSVFG